MPPEIRTSDAVGLGQSSLKLADLKDLD